MLHLPDYTAMFNNWQGLLFITATKHASRFPAAKELSLTPSVLWLIQMLLCRVQTLTFVMRSQVSFPSGDSDCASALHGGTMHHQPCVS